MNRGKYPLLILVSLPLVGALLFGQGIFSKPNRKAAKEKSIIKVHLFQTPSIEAQKTSVEVDLRIPIKAISFFRKVEVFQASVEYSIFVFDDDENLILTKIWKQVYVEDDFHNTKSDTKHISAETVLAMPAGDYVLEVKAVDIQNNETYASQAKITIKSHEPEAVVLSDIRLVTISGDDEKSRHIINPFLDEEIPENTDNLHIYFQVLHPGEVVLSGKVAYKIVNAVDSIRATYEEIIVLEPGISEHTIPLDTKQLSDKNYTVKLTIKSDTLLITREYPIHIAWLGISRFINDINMAIDQTRFVASRAELKAMRVAKGESERRAAFLKFWEARDPTPGTKKNELMDEYYARVAYSNRKYRGFRSGWESDFGMVFIIHGPPDDIENFPFVDNREPYQIWRYYSRNWQFVFVDQQAYGDYRLVTPLYPGGL